MNADAVNQEVEAPQPVASKESGGKRKVIIAGGLALSVGVAWLAMNHLGIGTDGDLGPYGKASGPQKQKFVPFKRLPDEAQKINPPVSLTEERVKGDVVATRVPAKKIEEKKVVPTAHPAPARVIELGKEKKKIEPRGNEDTHVAAVMNEAAVPSTAQSETGIPVSVSSDISRGEPSVVSRPQNLTAREVARNDMIDAFKLAMAQSKILEERVAAYARGQRRSAEGGTRKDQSASSVSLECERDFNGATQKNGKYTEACFYGDDDRLVFMATYHDKAFKNLDVERWYDKGGQVTAERYYNNGVVTKETRNGREVNIGDNKKLDNAEIAVNQQPH